MQGYVYTQEIHEKHQISNFWMSLSLHKPEVRVDTDFLSDFQNVEGMPQHIHRAPQQRLELAEA